MYIYLKGFANLGLQVYIYIQGFNSITIQFLSTTFGGHFFSGSSKQSDLDISLAGNLLYLKNREHISELL